MSEFFCTGSVSIKNFSILEHGVMIAILLTEWPQNRWLTWSACMTGFQQLCISLWVPIHNVIMSLFSEPRGIDLACCSHIILPKANDTKYTKIIHGMRCSWIIYALKSFLNCGFPHHKEKSDKMTFCPDTSPPDASLPGIWLVCFLWNIQHKSCIPCGMAVNWQFRHRPILKSQFAETLGIHFLLDACEFGASLHSATLMPGS